MSKAKMSAPIPDPKMSQLQQMQANYDKKHWEHNGEFEKIRHILLHLNKLNGKLATYCEAKEHGKDEVIIEEIKKNVPADLLIYALQLANLFGQNLADMRDKRIFDNIQRHRCQFSGCEETQDVKRFWSHEEGYVRLCRKHREMNEGKTGYTDEQIQSN